MLTGRRSEGCISIRVAGATVCIELLCSHCTLREFQYGTREEMIGMNVSNLVGGKVSARRHGKYLERFQKAGKSSSTIGKQRILKSMRKDGSEFRCIIGINRIPDVEEELLVGYIRNLDMANVESMDSSEDSLGADSEN